MRLDDVLHSHEGLFVSVFRDRDPLYATPDFQFPEDLIAQTQQARLGVASWKTAEREYRGMSASVTLPGSAEPPLQVWVAVDIAHHKHFMYALIQTLVGYVALATLVAGILGWWA
eukprot:gene19757-25275_t